MFVKDNLDNVLYFCKSNTEHLMIGDYIEHNTSKNAKITIITFSFDVLAFNIISLNIDIFGHTKRNKNSTHSTIPVL